jgi:hypothetical protein
VPLPSPATIRADVQRIVDFCPRLPGYIRRADAAALVLERVSLEIANARLATMRRTDDAIPQLA